MEKKEKELLLRDLSARFLYGVFLKIGEYSDYTLQGIVQSNVNKPLIVRCNGSDFECSIEVVKPYLRPMSSMTEEEKEMYETFFIDVDGSSCSIFPVQQLDWLNKNHFDYRGMIAQRLALPAPDGMYKTE